MACSPIQIAHSAEHVFGRQPFLCGLDRLDILFNVFIVWHGDACCLIINCTEGFL